MLEEIEKELRAGNYLKDDDRPLKRIMEDDAREVAVLDLDLDLITSRMEKLYEEGRKGLGDPVNVEDTFRVVVREDRGIIACPWFDHFASPKAIVEVENIKTGERLTYSVLALHMIRNHCFFQGKGSPFRIEPAELHDFFLVS